MTIRYLNKMYDVKYTQFNEDEIEIWIENSDDYDDVYYVHELPDHIQDTLYSMVDAVLYEPEEKFVGYLD